MFYCILEANISNHPCNNMIVAACIGCVNCMAYYLKKDNDLIFNNNNASGMHIIAYYYKLKITDSFKPFKYLTTLNPKYKHININTQDNNGQTPLIYAIIGHNSNIIKSLLDNGADPNIKDNNGLTPLFYAVKNKYFRTNEYKIIHLLLEKSTDLNVVDANFWTILHYAIINQYSRELIELFLEKGMDPYIKNADGKMPFDLTEDKKIKNIFRIYELDKFDLTNKDVFLN